MRLRLVIPAAIAAAATYTALVRDDALVATSRSAPTADPQILPVRRSAPVSVPQIVPPRTVEPARPAPIETPEPAAEHRANALDAPAPPSPYADMAEPVPANPATPSMFDLLAGSPPREDAPPEALAGVADDAVVDDAPVPVDVDAPVPVVASDPTPWAPVDGETIPGDPTSEPDAARPGEPWQPPLDEGRFALGGWAAAPGHSMVSAVTFRRRLGSDVATRQIVLEVDVSENVPGGGVMVLSNPGFAPDRDGFTLLLEAAEAGPFSAAGSYRVLPAI